jgi:RimJ/RimL family protein N-acetyltransferase
MIETQRLLLLPFTYDLVVATLHGKSELERVLGFKVSEEWPSSEYANRIPAKKEKLQKSPESSIWSLIAIDKESHTLIGEIGCKGGPDENGTVEIGYGMVSQVRNRGYATEMIKGLTEWLFERPEVKKVTAKCLQSNKPSARVLEKSGFIQLEFRDGLIRWEKNIRK